MNSRFRKKCWRVFFGVVLIWMLEACSRPQVHIIYEQDGNIAAESPLVQNDVGPGYDVLATFSDAVGRYDYFGGGADDASYEYMLRQVQEILLPQKELLHTQAVWRWSKIPVAPRMDTTDWGSAIDEDKAAELREFYSLFLGIAPDELSEAVRYFYTWDMVQMFEFMRRALLMQVYPMHIAGTVSSIDAMMVPPFVRLNDDPEHPVLAIQREREFFMISFEYDARACVYTPQNVEWLLPLNVLERIQNGQPSETETFGTASPDEQALPYRLGLAPNAEYLTVPVDAPNEKRYRRWKPKTRIRVGQTHLSTADWSVDETHLLLMSDAEAAIRIYALPSKKLVGRYWVDGFSPDTFSAGEALFWPSTRDGLRFVVGNDTGLAIYSALDGTLIERVNSYQVSQLRFSPDNRYLLCTRAHIDTQTTTLYVYARVEDSNTLAVVGVIESDERIEDLALSRDNQLLAITYYPSNTVALYDVQTGTEKWKVDAPVYTNSIDISPDGAVVAVGGNRLLLIDAISPARQATYRKFNNNIHRVRFSPSGDAVAASSYDGHVRIVSSDVQTSELTLLADLRHGGTANVYSIEFRTDGSGLVSSSGDKSAIIWER
ncbi:MAG: hypothetical protein JXX29_02755 [Deltaproteobacteria bacterium]|nr:hypothetical protein [Deltaproteobacteria bacterium]MBN2670562.1 hypothetical protein [Deltaproteobacteria bacterium]